MVVEVELRFYAHLRDVVGAKTIRREFPSETTVRDVVEAIAEEFPELREYAFEEDGTIRDTFVVRRNRATVDLEETVADGDRFGMTTQVVGG